MVPNNFIAVRLTFERIAIIAVFIFCIFITILFQKQLRNIERLKSEINHQETLLQNVDWIVDDLENQKSDFERKIDDLETKIDDLEKEIDDLEFEMDYSKIMRNY